MTSASADAVTLAISAASATGAAPSPNRIRSCSEPTRTRSAAYTVAAACAAKFDDMAKLEDVGKEDAPGVRGGTDPVSDITPSPEYDDRWCDEDECGNNTADGAIVEVKIFPEDGPGVKDDECAGAN